MKPKIFTLNEANALLPRLKEDLASLQALTREYEEQVLLLQKLKGEFQLSSGRRASGDGRFFEAEGRLDFMRMEIQLQVDNFARKGVLLKMINPGLIDFPAVLDGEDVLICWKEGEDRAAHYHGWHDGVKGRKPIPGADAE